MKKEEKSEHALLASHTAKKQVMVKKLAALGEDPEWWKEQLEQIADGKSLEEIAVVLQVNFSILRHWIMGDVKREKEYVEAFAEQRRRRKEKIEDRLYKTAMNPTGHPKFADSLRAAEILLGAKNSDAGLVAGGGSINLNVMFVEAKDGRPSQPIIDNGGTVIDQVP